MIDDIVLAAFSFLTAGSCFLLINHMPAKKRWLEKTLAYFVGLSAFALFVSPICGVRISASMFEIVYVAGTALFSVWLTYPYWRELPLLDRRKRRVYIHYLQNRRGMPRDDEVNA